METNTNFFNRNHWSKNRFAWMYAVLIAILAIGFAIILKSAGIYEGMALRNVNFLFILLGFIVLIWDYKSSTKNALTYLQAFLLLVRTGLYFCLLFLPILLIFIGTFSDELQIVREKETFTSDFPVIQLVFSTYLETVATIAIAAMTVAFTANFSKKKSDSKAVSA
ncbi:hypothetical protein LCGC14_1093960 [marine sediment metagenome]|uniref:Uncharacterized protein n=2 Tax=root TaxID=1 RepID=A0A831QTR5_9FLAO|nr:hypothetical protein [Pricia antarctica]